MTRLSLLLLVAAACTSETGGASSGGDPFDVPKGSANPATILGVWESAAPSKEPPYSAVARYELRADHIVSATRCTADDGSAQPVTVSVRVAATVTEQLIKATESAQKTEHIGATGLCSVQMGKGSMPACDPQSSETARAACFALTGENLVFYQSNGKSTMLKISD